MSIHEIGPKPAFVENIPHLMLLGKPWNWLKTFTYRDKELAFLY